MAKDVAKFKSGAIDPEIETALSRLPWRAILRAGKTLKHGLKYEEDLAENWRHVPVRRHLDHALEHIAKHEAGDRSEDHVGHALTRLMFWAELKL